MRQAAISRFKIWLTVCSHAGALDPLLALASRSAISSSTYRHVCRKACWTRRLLQRPIAEDKRQKLISVAGRGDRDSIRKVVELIVSMPEFQLC